MSRGASGRPAALLAGLLVALLAGRTGAEQASDAERAAARGVAFLVSSQRADGAWGSFETRRPSEVYTDTVASHRAFEGATTALCVLALERPARRDPTAARAFQRGLERLLAAPPVGRASGQTFYDTWTHTYLVEALARAASSPLVGEGRAAVLEVLRREVALLCERQAADGGWGYYDFQHSRPVPSGHESTSFLTAAALLALRAAAAAGVPPPTSAVEDGLTCLARLRLPSGAYAYGTYAQLMPAWDPNEVKGSLGRAQPCNLALVLHDRGVDTKAMRTGLETLRGFDHFVQIGRGRPVPHEAWYATAGYYALFGRWYAARVASALPPGERGELPAWIASSTIRWQDPDGSWFDFPLYGYHKPYGTALALLTLQELAPD